MKTKQISVFLDNKPKDFADCIKILSVNGIKITAMVLTKKSELRILHFVANDPEKASKLLHKNGYGIGETEVLLVDLPYQTKSLADFLNRIKGESDTTIDYMYMGGNHQFVFRFDDLTSALQTLNTTS